MKYKKENRLKEKRRKSTQQYIAKQLNISQCFVSKMLSGKAKVPGRLKEKFENIINKY